jgi:low molecular weight protein-tyrosine phosphatase
VTASVLFVCRANLCRSPSAEVMLMRALAGAGVEAKVASAGMEVVAGQVPPEDFVEIALVRGIDLRAHEPSAFTAELGEAADVILTMTRSLLRTMVLKAPSIWPRSFTLLELVRRGTSIEPPEPGDTLATWLARVHGSRDRAELSSLDPIDDLGDPMVDATESNEDMFGQLERATRRLARLLAAVSGSGSR